MHSFRGFWVFLRGPGTNATTCTRLAPYFVSWRGALAVVGQTRGFAGLKHRVFWSHFDPQYLWRLKRELKFAGAAGKSIPWRFKRARSELLRATRTPKIQFLQRGVDFYVFAHPLGENMHLYVVFVRISPYECILFAVFWCFSQGLAPIRPPAPDLCHIWSVGGAHWPW